MTMNYKIVTEQMVLGRRANAVVIDGISVSIGSHAIVNYSVQLIGIYQDSGATPQGPEYICSGQMYVGGDEYNGWSDDDDYLLTLVARRLGFQIPA